MAADPIIYCLEQLTDYAEFERLCHDLMALEGYRSIEPLGGTKDKGRDAFHLSKTDGAITVFAYSVRDDWQHKLTEDSEKVSRTLGLNFIVDDAALKKSISIPSVVPILKWLKRPAS